MPRFEKPETKTVDGYIFKQCSKCSEFKKIELFRSHITGYLGTRAACKDCEQKWREDNRETTRKYMREYAQGKTLEKFEISLEKYNELVSKGCMICGGMNNLHIDHHHGTGQFRGILCINCNTGIGSFRDNPELLLRAASYLESREKVKNALV